MAGILDLIGKGLSGVGILGGGDTDTISPEDRRYNNGFSGSSSFANDKVGQKLSGTEQKTGLFNRPGASEALIAFGANMLAAPSFGQGIGAGASAFLDTLREEEDRRKPKTQFLADGAIQASIDPMTGKVSYAPVQEVQDWQKGLTLDKLQGQLDLQGARGDDRLEQIMLQGQLGAQRADADREARLTIAQMQQAGASERAMLAAMSRGSGNSPMMPATARNALDKIIAERDGYQTAYDAVGDVFSKLAQGKLKLGLWNNTVNKLGLAGIASGGPDMKEYQEFKSALERARNAILMGNKGVQTEGDAVRAMDQIIAGTGDTKAAADALGRYLIEVQKKGYQATNRANRYIKPYGEPELDRFQTRKFGNKPKAGAGPVRISSDAQFNTLPSGATFIGPDGKIRKKP